jgi:DNA polymerase-3 subunit delta'
MSADHNPREPSRKDLAARDEAVDEAGGPAPPAAAGPGFGAIIGQEQTVAALRRAILRNRLPHALLLHGAAGVGKATTAGVLAQALNCAVSDFVDACGTCASCRKVTRGLHPDVLWVGPAKGKIRIGQVSPRKRHQRPTGGRPDLSEDTPGETKRGSDSAPPHEPIVHWVGFKPYEGRRRVVVIDDAQAMNHQAQNALLKTLEEPPPSAVLVLVTPAPGSLLPTIRSRCQPLRLQPLGIGLMRRHLQETCGMSAEEARLRAALAPGSLGRAMSLDLDDYNARRDVAAAAVADACTGGAALLASAETLLSAGAGERKIDQALSAMSAVRDILRDLLVLASGKDGELVVNLDRIEEWADWATRLDADAIVEALRSVQHADDRLHAPLQPNVRLTVEEALIGVGTALRGPS